MQSLGRCLRSDCQKAPENLSQAASSSKCMQFAPIAKETNPIVDCETHHVLFATHNTLGVLDTGATKTVIGSDFVAELLGNLTEDARRQVRRCKCSIVFRFGNQGTLESSQALVIPIGNLMLKVAIVPGRTPFLISNTLVRTLKASIDAERDVLRSRLLTGEVPLKVTPKGLYLVDLNDLINAGQKPRNARSDVTSTFVSEASDADQPSIEKNPKISRVRELINSWENIPSLQSNSSKMNMMKHDQQPVSQKSIENNSIAATKVLKDSESPQDTVKDVARQQTHADAEPEPTISNGGSGSQRLDARRPQGGDCGLREHPHGQNIPDGMGSRTRMGLVDDPTLCQESKDVPPAISEVCGADGQREREESRSSASATERTRNPDGKELDDNDAPSQEAGRISQEDGWKSLFKRKDIGIRVGGSRRDAGRTEWRDVTMADYEGSTDGDRERGSSGSPGDTNAEYGERAHASHPAHRPVGPGTSQCRASESVREAEIFIGAEMNGERGRLSKLIQQMEHEFEKFQEKHPRKVRKRISLLEVFCSKDSPLTHQVRSLGGQAIRHGLTEGNLQTPEGRESLFAVLNMYEPEHVWVSPECGPWSSWMSLNASKSVEHWDRCQNERWQMLDQVALCIVLFRIQRRRQKQFHWEQPVRSLMFSLPYLHEVHDASRIAQCDMCTIGDLKDPVSMKPMKKGLWIMTTSEIMFNEIHGRTCNHEHDHEAIAGSTKVNGKVIARTKFTARYPRKFARLIAKTCISHTGARCKATALVGESESSATIRVTSSQLPGRRFGKTPAPCKSELIDLQMSSKRRRMEGKQHQSQDEANRFVELINQNVPRVGKTEIQNPQLVQQIQAIMGDKRVIKIVGCRGTDRTIGPPKNLMNVEAPYRKAIVILRENGDLKIEKHWEEWSRLSKRQIVRPAHACRVNITVFAQNPEIENTIRTDAEMHEVRPVEQQPRVEADATQSLTPLETGSQIQSQDSRSPDSMRTAEISRDETRIRKEEHGPRFRSLTKEEQQKLIRAHQNLGHPSNDRLSNALKLQGCRSEVSNGVLDMSCPTCQEARKPRHARPSRLHDCSDFNDKISMDGIQWTNKEGKKMHLYHVIDHGTNYHTAIIAPNRSSESAIECLHQMWLCWAGMPNEIVTDAATEFESEEFQAMLQRNGVESVVTNPDSHWQLGKTERHGSFLQSMLQKIDMERPIRSYHDLQLALTQCTSAKNCLSQKGGYTPQMLVFGKNPRIPGSIIGDESLPAHCLAEDENSFHGKQFREQLELRTKAREAFHKADNDASLRRAMLRRTCPFRGRYENGDQVMCWKNGQGNTAGRWWGPMRVIVQDGDHTVWTTMSGHLHRMAPENVRPVSLNEEERGRERNLEMPACPPIREEPNAEIPETTQESFPEENNPERETPERQITQNTDRPSEQPDQEPEVKSIATEENSNSDENEIINFVCTELEKNVLLADDMTECAWRQEFEVPWTVDQLNQNTQEENLALLVTSAKRQRTEVRLSSLTKEEQKEFEKAKQAEIQNWLTTGTVVKIMRDQIDPEQVLRCRWILTWKPLDPSDCKPGKTHKAKARLVVLGYLDNEAANTPRDSPTLSKPSRMLALQLIASMSWKLQSFDIKAAFLQGKPTDRVMAIEPVPEMRTAMNLKSNEVARLAKSAYGLMSAPLQWYAALHEELTRLGFQSAPMDPCLYILRNPETQMPSGIIGIHVDDGICGGDEVFQAKLKQLEKKYPFGSYKTSEFTFTGVELKQQGDHSIVLSQEKYIGKIQPIKIDPNRKTLENENVNEAEKQALRGLIGSLQYAATNTRPDLSAKLSSLQSEINKATVGTLLSANRVLHEAKAHRDVKITIKPIPLKNFCFMAFSDASFASKTKPESHSGAVIVGTHIDIMKNHQCPISPLMWGCHKIQKIVTSTLAAETISLASALDQLSWIRIYWAWILDGNTKWKEPEKTLEKLPSALSVPTLREYDVAITDCKSLYDMTTRTAMPSCAEYRTQLQARSIKEMLNEGVKLRWVHSGAQLADALTKWMESHFLRESLRVGTYRLCDEEATLKNRAKTRDRIKWLKSQEENIYFLGV